MATLDLTLNKLLVPGIENYTPAFGTKRSDNVSLTSEEVADNIALPFSRQRPVSVSEDSVTGAVEADCAILIEKSGLKLTLGEPAFAGCHVTLIAGFDSGSSTVTWKDASDGSVSTALSKNSAVELVGGADLRFHLMMKSADGILENSESVERSHNVPRYMDGALGKDITSYYTDGTLWDRIAGTNGFSLFEDIYAGDYFQMSKTSAAKTGDGKGIQCPGENSSYATNTVDCSWVTIAGIDTLRGNGDTVTMDYHHLVMVPGKGEEGIQHFGLHRMNASDTTEGGYVGSEMFKSVIGAVALEGSTASGATINQQLYAEFGSHLKTTRELLSNTMTSTLTNRFGSATGASSNWAWTSCQAVLMSEVEVYGSTVWSSSGFDTGNANRQLPLFAFSKKAQNNRSAWYWLKSIASSGYFCCSDAFGESGCGNASMTDRFVRPRFVIA